MTTCTKRLRDHPRSRGVYYDQDTREEIRDGSSPLARGLHQARLRRPGLRRIIPARAGFTTPTPSARCRLTDHPRSRGVYMIKYHLEAKSMGSSPLARGLPSKALPMACRFRIIPARAGFTDDE